MNIAICLLITCISFLQDHHCSELALKAAAVRRQQAAATPAGEGKKPTVPALVYPQDAAWQAIRRFTPKPPFSEFAVSIVQYVTDYLLSFTITDFYCQSTD